MEIQKTSSTNFIYFIWSIPKGTTNHLTTSNQKFWTCVVQCFWGCSGLASPTYHTPEPYPTYLSNLL